LYLLASGNLNDFHHAAQIIIIEIDISDAIYLLYTSRSLQPSGPQTSKINLS